MLLNLLSDSGKNKKMAVSIIMLKPYMKKKALQAEALSEYAVNLLGRYVDDDTEIKDGWLRNE